MEPLFKKYPSEKYLLPSADVLNADIPTFLNKMGIDWTRAVMYRTVSSDLSDISIKDYDILAFFSPQGIKSLKQNFPDFEQGDTKIAVFGTTTQTAAKEAGLKVDIMAPSKDTPSMTMALEKYIKKVNK